MFLLDDRLILSPSDLRQASECEFALVTGLDVLLGRAPQEAQAEDPMLARIAELGDLHEQAELRRLGRVHPGGVVSLSRPEHSLTGYAAGMADTRAALDSGATVLAQATLFDGSFVGYADFIERTDAGWLVSDTKLARSATVPALLQVAAYAAQLLALDVPVAPVARLVLGSGDIADEPLAEILPVYRRRRRRLEEVLADHRHSPGPATWGDPRWTACGRCAVCEARVESTGDLLLVAGMRASTRKRLHDSGITHIEELAAHDGPVSGLSPERLAALRSQARLQVRQAAHPQEGPAYEVFDEDALRRLPRPSPGDIFFDFEGDPLWHEPGSPVWGLEYLFGLVEVDSGEPEFTAFWAHERAEEKKALEDFVAHVHARRRRWPDLHVYHYAAYEVSGLTRLAARHSTCEDDIDSFLRDGLFVDLYASVRSAVRVSQRSYSLKKLEPLYMGARTAEVQKGDDSIVEYHLFRAAREQGRVDEAAERLRDIADYNREDCISTWKLRDWLIGLVGLDRVGAAQEAPEQRPPSDRRLAQLTLEATVRGLIESVPIADRTPEDQAVAMVAAGVLYHAREDKPAWWRHYDRILLKTDQWQRDAGVAVVEGDGAPEVITDWDKPPGKRLHRRVYSLTVDPISGTLLDDGPTIALYAVPAPFDVSSDHDVKAAHARNPSSVEILASEELLADNGRVLQRLTVVENAPGDVPFEGFPVAFVPTGPIPTGSIDAALEELAGEVAAEHPAMVARAGIDVLLRRCPRMRAGGALPAVGTGPDRFVDAVTSALTGMDDSYVAVQGPPGTGKTYVGARVIRRLVDLGWRIGVCSQSHAAIENLLEATLAAGVPGEQVAKAPKHSANPAWTALRSSNDLASFIAEQATVGRGFVVGGTAWDLTNTGRVERGGLDLVVIDEAGQFSLAKTLAVSMAGTRLLLLGDPAQLPQVSQGTHAEPVNESALGWLTADSPVLPGHLGYFLETTWRMHPRLTEAVSHLSYAGRLTSQVEVTGARSLAGIEPGLHVLTVEHVDNAQWSPEEAAAVVALVRDLLGRDWHDPAEHPEGRPGGIRPLAQPDIVVITPYNAQVGTIRVALRAAGLPDVPVGTVDKFQGQEAPVAILSMAASAHTDVPRGISFLLDRHRLNVAISRGKYASWIVRSNALTDFPPSTTDELLALGAFLALCARAPEGEPLLPAGVRR